MREAKLNWAKAFEGEVSFKDDGIYSYLMVNGNKSIHVDCTKTFKSLHVSSTFRGGDKYEWVKKLEKTERKDLIRYIVNGGYAQKEKDRLAAMRRAAEENRRVLSVEQQKKKDAYDILRKRGVLK